MNVRVRVTSPIAQDQITMEVETKERDRTTIATLKLSRQELRDALGRETETTKHSYIDGEVTQWMPANV